LAWGGDSETKAPGRKTLRKKRAKSNRRKRVGTEKKCASLREGTGRRPFSKRAMSNRKESDQPLFLNESTGKGEQKGGSGRHPQNKRKREALPTSRQLTSQRQK